MNRIGRYQLRRRIKADRASVVYLVRDSETGRDVVIKMLQVVRSGGAAETTPLRDRVKYRLESVSRLHHQNLVPVEDVFEEMGLLWLVMEYVPGEPLDQLLSDKTFLTKDRIRKTLRQIAECLDYAHQRGVFHQHIKPSNIIVQGDGKVRILGFGLGNPPDASSNGSDVRGSSCYLSPEQIAGAPGDSRSDQFALAGIAFRLLTGEPPFERGHEPLSEDSTPERPPRPDHLNPSLEPEAGQVLLRGLAENPDERYGSCVSFVTALERALDKVPNWLPPEPVPSSDQTAPDQPETLEDLDDQTTPELAEPSDHLVPFDETAPQSPRMASVVVWLIVGLLVGSYVSYIVLSGGGSPIEGDMSPSIVPAALPKATLGEDYGFEFSLTNGTPLRWSLAQGALPAGLTLDTADGRLYGAPTDVGDFSFSVTATLGSGEVVSEQFKLKVTSDLEITTLPVLPRGVVTQSYSHPLVASGVRWPWRWELVDGSLPPGIELNSTAGKLEGFPSEPGDFEFTLQVTDGSQATGSQTFKLTVEPGFNLSIAPSLPGGIVGQPYRHQLSAGAGNPPYRWAVSQGSFPPGISLEPHSGRVQGTPRRAGTYRLELRVTDAEQATAVRDVSLRVAPSLEFTAPSELPGGTAGATYASQLGVRGGRPPYRWTLAGGSLPPGLSLDPSSGAIRGTPSSAGTYRFTASVTDATKAGTNQTFSVTISTGLIFRVASELPVAEVSAAYQQELPTSQGNPPYRWEIADGELPPGLSLDPRRGRITGAAQQPGQFQFTARVVDASQAAATQAFTLNVLPALRISEDLKMPPAAVDEPYRVDLRAVGGMSPHTWTVSDGSLPPGLSLDSQIGLLTGTPRLRGEFRFTLRVTSGSQGSASRPFVLVVGPPNTGQLVWRGQLGSNRVLTIQDGAFASTGSLTDSLPGIPVRIELEPEGLIVVEPPRASNDWKLLVIHTGFEPRTQIVVKWTRIE